MTRNVYIFCRSIETLVLCESKKNDRQTGNGIAIHDKSTLPVPLNHEKEILTTFARYSIFLQKTSFLYLTFGGTIDMDTHWCCLIKHKHRVVD